MSAEDVVALNLHLDVQPHDWQARLVLADLYEEAGDETRALGQRWLAKHRKYPELMTEDDHCADIWEVGKWFWWSKSNLPEDDHAIIGMDNSYPCCIPFDSRTEAEDDFVIWLLSDPNNDGKVWRPPEVTEEN